MIKRLSLVVLMLLAVSSSFLVYADAEQVESTQLKPTQLKPQRLPVDSDVDGVIDKVDECYKTPLGVEVDERGCQVVFKDLKTVRLNINFAYDSAVVRTDFYSDIEKIAIFMRKHLTTRVIIEGHTDSDGAAAYNRSLSGRRAQAAARLLISKFGIEPIRVTAVGFGEDRPLVANDSVANKAKNRRVVAVIRTLKEKRG